MHNINTKVYAATPNFKKIVEFALQSMKLKESLKAASTVFSSQSKLGHYTTVGRVNILIC